MANHHLIWKATDGTAPNGADGLMRWREYFLAANPKYFRDVAPSSGDAQVGHFAELATIHAIDGAVDVTVAWGSHDLWATPADNLEAVFWQLEPRVLVCPSVPANSIGGVLQPRAQSTRCQGRLFSLRSHPLSHSAFLPGATASPGRQSRF
jgi:hypothetical protein